MVLPKSKEVQGLLYKVAELETLLIILIGILDAKEILDTGEIQSLYEVADLPEILAARIQLIEQEGAKVLETREHILREKLRMRPFTPEEKGEMPYGDQDTD